MYLSTACDHASRENIGIRLCSTGINADTRNKQYGILYEVLAQNMQDHMSHNDAYIYIYIGDY